MKWNSETISDNGVELYKVEYNFFQGAYLRERKILRIYDIVPDVLYFRRFKTNIGVIPWIELYPINGEILLCVDDFVNFEEIGTSISLELYVTKGSGVGRWGYTFNILGLLPVEGMIIPQISTIQPNVPIIPPSILFSPLSFGSFEVYNQNSGNLSLIIRDKNGGSTSYNLSQKGGYQISYLNDDDSIELVSDGNLVYRSRILRHRCGRDYAMVSWYSRYGLRKTMAWEVRDIEESGEVGIKLQSLTSYSNEKKDYSISFVLYLDNLTKYDYWYYSDIISSNDVRVAFSPNDFVGNTINEFQRVVVTTNKVAIPNANGTYKLEIEVKYKDYDYTISH